MSAADTLTAAHALLLAAALLALILALAWALSQCTVPDGAGEDDEADGPDRGGVVSAAICTGYDADGDCDQQVAWTAMTACVHEHIQPLPLCQWHLEDLAHERLYCGDCLESSDPHDCVLVAIPVRSPA